ncbi:glycosyltransferase family 90 protein, partial [Rhodotorula graminis WP1]
HPISHLVSRAEQEWDDLLRRQSQTLEDAVAEYRRRYGMNPPVGFDSWWRYAMQNHVRLVDEYDQVHSDVLPFLSLAPSEFRRRVKSL